MRNVIFWSFVFSAAAFGCKTASRSGGAGVKADAISGSGFGQSLQFQKSNQPIRLHICYDASNKRQYMHLTQAVTVQRFFEQYAGTDFLQENTKSMDISGEDSDILPNIQQVPASELVSALGGTAVFFNSSGALQSGGTVGGTSLEDKTCTGIGTVIDLGERQCIFLKATGGGKTYMLSAICNNRFGLRGQPGGASPTTHFIVDIDNFDSSSAFSNDQSGDDLAAIAYVNRNNLGVVQRKHDLTSYFCSIARKFWTNMNDAEQKWKSENCEINQHIAFHQALNWMDYHDVFGQDSSLPGDPTQLAPESGCKVMEDFVNNDFLGQAGGSTDAFVLYHRAIGLMCKQHLTANGAKPNGVDTCLEGMPTIAGLTNKIVAAPDKGKVLIDCGVPNSGAMPNFYICNHGCVTNQVFGEPDSCKRVSPDQDIAKDVVWCPSQAQEGHDFSSDI